MDRKGRFDLTDAEQAFKREGWTTSACHASVPVEYWQEWVKKFEMVFVNSFFTKKNTSLDWSLKEGINSKLGMNCKIKVHGVFRFSSSMLKTSSLQKNSRIEDI